MDDDKDLEVGEWLVDRLLLRKDVASLTYRVKMNCSPIGEDAEDQWGETEIKVEFK